MNIQRLDTNLHLSAAVQYKDLIFLSGQVPNYLEGDIKQQTLKVLNKIDTLLAKTNSDKSYILSAQIWLKNIAKDFTLFNQCWENWLPTNSSPARVTVQADMAKPGVLVEIMVIALKNNIRL